MPDPISNLGQLVEVLRRQLASRPESERATARGNVSQSVDTPNSGSTFNDIQANIRGKVAAINPNDPERRKKAIRIFIESVLHQEFGDRVIHDPRLYSLASEIQQTMETEPTIKTKLDQLVDELIRG